MRPAREGSDKVGQLEPAPCRICRRSVSRRAITGVCPFGKLSEGSHDASSAALPGIWICFSCSPRADDTSRVGGFPSDCVVRAAGTGILLVWTGDVVRVQMTSPLAQLRSQ